MTRTWSHGKPPPDGAVFNTMPRKLKRKALPRLRYRVEFDGVAMGQWATLSAAVEVVLLLGQGARVVMP